MADKEAMRVGLARQDLVGQRPRDTRILQKAPTQLRTSDHRALLNPPRKLAFPYDLNALASGAGALLASQGYSVASAATKSELCFFDSDMTLMASARTPVWLKHKDTGDRLRHPESDELVEFGLDPNAEVAVEYDRMRKQYPDLAWEEYVPDGSAASDPRNILPSPPIAAALNLYRAAHQNENAAAFVITGRGDQDTVVHAIQRWLSQRQLEADGVLMMYHPEHQAALSTGDAKGLPIKKTISMAGIIQEHLAAGAPLRTVRFVEDSADNLKTAEQILPSLFPEIEFQWVLIEPKKGGSFSARRFVSDAPGVSSHPFV